MSTPGPQPSDRLSEELVAYLDGELSAGESESIELRLHQDDHVRSELQKFDRVWNALDDLPRVTVDDSFTRTTIEMAAVEARKELAHETVMFPVRRRNHWLKLVAMVVTASAIGFASFAALAPNPNRVLYTNLPVILQLDAYSEVRDIEFLKLLHAQAGDWLLDEWGPEIQQSATDLATVTPATYTEREEFVDSLPADRQTDLASKHRRYESLAPEMREELNEWHRSLSASPSAEELRQTLLAYYAWVSQQSEVDQARLRMLAPTERLAMVQEMHTELARRNLMNLSPRDAAALRAAMDAAAKDPEIDQLRLAMIRSLPDDDKLAGQMPRERIEALKKLKSRLPGMSPQLSMRMVLWLSSMRGVEPRGPEFVAYRNAIESRLLAALSPQTAADLEKDPLARTRRLAWWVAVASHHDEKPDQATLEEFFVSGSLTEDEKRQLLARPPEQMLKELEVRYAREFMDSRELDAEWHELMQDFGRGRFGGGRGWNDRDGRRPQEWGEGGRRDERRDGPGDRPMRNRPDGPPGDRGPRERGGSPFGEGPPLPPPRP